MLARSSASKEIELENIVESTAAVIFLGTPHRGSLEVAALGEVVRSVVSTLGMETTPAILDSLGLKTTDLERAQEEFSKLWQNHDFRVKTFQEGLSLAKIGKKVVPDYSSLIGDHREHAETLQANHLEMCRFSGTDDPNYRKVAGELRSIYHSIARLNTEKTRRGRRTQGPMSALSASSSAKPSKVATGSHVDDACLESLWFPAINTRHESLERPAEQTCSWLFDHELYQDWFNSRNREKHYGLLWLKGKPGAGKSTLMKEAFRRAGLGQAKSDYRTAAFFFSAKGDELEYSPLGLFRSLLYQLLPSNSGHLRTFQAIWDAKRSGRRDIRENTVCWSKEELESFFESMFTEPTRRTMIFVDALDECDPRSVRSMAYLWRRITKSAHTSGVGLNVCLSSRHFPSVTLSDCPEIIVEQHNSHDIATYVDHRFQLGIATREPRWQLLRDNILEKSAGVFLWVVLVVDDVLGNWDDGKDIRYLTKRVKDCPEALETLFSDMFSVLRPEARELTVRFFQWAILAAKPLRLHEWHHIMAFIRQPTPESLSEWCQSDNYTANDDQLERQIRSVSRGLVEVKKAIADDSQDKGFESMSVYAGAGSLNLEHGDTRIVQVIHESVRDFFLRNNGFSVLDSDLESNPIGNGHLSIMATCLDYLNITELDALVEARVRAARQDRSRPRRRRDWTEGTYFSPPSSHSGYTRYQSLTHDEKSRARHGKRPAKKEEQTTVFETLRSSDSTPNVDVVEWITRNQNSSTGSLSLYEQTCMSPMYLSVGGRSQVLEDHPALLSYAIFRFFEHALLAEEHGADPSPIVERLKDGTTWARWVTLREDISEQTEILTHAANLGLSSWVGALSEDPKSPQSNVMAGARPMVSTDQGLNNSPLSDDVPLPSLRPTISSPPTFLSDDLPTSLVGSFERPPLANSFNRGDTETSLRFHASDGSCHDSSPQPLSRPGSVASFSSAGSHNGPAVPKFGTRLPAQTFPGYTAPPFQTQDLLNSHANVHSSVRPHYCPVIGCPRSEGGKGFKRKNEMIRHGLVHDSPGYTCPFCADRFHIYPRPDNLQRYD